MTDHPQGTDGYHACRATNMKLVIINSHFFPILQTQFLQVKMLSIIKLQMLFDYILESKYSTKIPNTEINRPHMILYFIIFF